MEQNRRAWLGQAACRLRARAPAIATRAAWPQLTDDQRATANACAARVIREWETDRAGGQPALFYGDHGEVWETDHDGGQPALFHGDDGVTWDA
jgi:hypothetical protein